MKSVTVAMWAVNILFAGIFGKSIKKYKTKFNYI